ncbi:MAG: hypothetical protein MHM6MM_007668 [Cercozoa sp. M6MM]
MQATFDQRTALRNILDTLPQMVNRFALQSESFFMAPHTMLQQLDPEQHAAVSDAQKQEAAEFWGKLVLQLQQLRRYFGAFDELFERRLRRLREIHEQQEQLLRQQLQSKEWLRVLAQRFVWFERGLTSFRQQLSPSLKVVVDAVNLSPERDGLAFFVGDDTSGTNASTPTQGILMSDFLALQDANTATRERGHIEWMIQQLLTAAARHWPPPPVELRESMEEKAAAKKEVEEKEAEKLPVPFDVSPSVFVQPEPSEELLQAVHRDILRQQPRQRVGARAEAREA